MKKFHHRKGLTLLEIVLAIGLSMVILLAVTRFVGTTSLLGTMISQKLQSNQDVVQTLQTFKVEVRSMGQSSAGGYPIEAAGSSSLIFYSDIDEDGLMERVRYYFGTSTLEKGVIKPTGNPPTYLTANEVIKTVIPAVIVGSSSFYYYDASYTGTQPPLALPLDVSRVRLVGLTLVADVSTSSAPKPVVISNTIDVRNLRSN